MFSALNKNIFLVFIFFLLFFIFIFPSKTLAASCGLYQQDRVTACNNDPPNCTIGNTSHDVFNCDLVGNSCQTTITSASCVYSTVGGPHCELTPENNKIGACDGSGGGGGGGNCNHDYSCSKGCNANKIVSDSKCGGSCGKTAGGVQKVCCDGGCIPEPTPTPNPCTAPTITSVTRLSSTKVKITWAPGANTSSQSIYIGQNKTGVESNCTTNQSPACVLKLTGVGAGATTYTTGNILVPGKVYYIRVVNAGSCNLASATSAYLSSCSVTPVTVNMDTSSTATLTTTVSASSEVTKVHYSLSGSGGIVSLSPVDDTTYVYGTTITSSNTPGTVTVNSSVYFGATIACTATGTIKTTPPGPWWQAKDADIATNGDIKSDIPDTAYKLVSDGPGGYPGTVVYGGNIGLSSGGVSSKNWQSDTTINTSKVYDYSYFESQIPATTIMNDASLLAGSGGVISADGYYWYKYDGSVTGLPFTISSNLALGSRKTVLLVKSADLNINGRINLLDGSGFFMAIVGSNSTGAKGNIVVSPTVGGGTALIEGIYLSDGTFSTGTTGGTDTRFGVRGSVAAYGGVSLDRDLINTNTTTPAELFEYAPDQVLLFPKVLSVRKINWKEVAP